MIDLKKIRELAEKAKQYAGSYWKTEQYMIEYHKREITRDEIDHVFRYRDIANPKTMLDILDYIEYLEKPKQCLCCLMTPCMHAVVHQGGKTRKVKFKKEKFENE